MANLEIINPNLVSNGEALIKNTIGSCIIIDSSLSDDDIYTMNEKAKLTGHPMFTHHYFIDKTGDIFYGRDESYQAYVDDRFNKNCIGIMLQGNFNEEELSEVQLNNLILLIFDIKTRNPFINNSVYLHSELNKDYSNTPGQLFPYIKFKNRLYRNFLQLTSVETNATDELVYELGSRSFEYKIPNMCGTDIYQFKLFLIKLGYKIKNLNGEYDLELFNIVKLFIKDYDLQRESYYIGIVDKDLIEYVQNLIIRDRYDRSENYKRYLSITSPLMIGNDIKFIKEKLYTLGIYKGDINTLYDEELAEAVGKFQAKYNYTVNKEVGPLTFNEIKKCEDYSFNRVLEMAEPLMEGADIEIIQKALYHYGYNVAITGFYDIKTYNAVCKFQLDNNFLVDGRVDEFTFNEILKSKNF